MNFDDFRRRADRVRPTPLETVLACFQAVRDPRDRHKWHTEQGPVSVTGPKFTNWHRNVGGGGAIDLVMHLAKLDAPAAVAWLEQHLPVDHAAAGGAANVVINGEFCIEHGWVRPAMESRSGCRRTDRSRRLVERRRLFTQQYRRWSYARKSKSVISPRPGDG